MVRSRWEREKVGEGESVQVRKWESVKGEKESRGESGQVGK